MYLYRLLSFRSRNFEIVSSVFDIVVTGDSCQSKCLEISGYMLSIGNNAIDDVDYAKERRASES